jgi:hypothetical protein
MNWQAVEHEKDDKEREIDAKLDEVCSLLARYFCKIQDPIHP